MSTFIRLSTISFLFVALASSITACSSDDDEPTTDPAAIKSACLDLADDFAKAYARCGADYQQVYDLYLAQAGGPQCSNVLSIRDEGELRSRCIPWLRSASCTDLQTEGKVDASCKDQLQVGQKMSLGNLAPQGTQSVHDDSSLGQLFTDR